ncbi:MAG TPA: efflux RND transporter periplasmic adaptor subunit [Polyangiaceae bacterium]|nr:efflux RND transporter periplasmic adaptor subunit [Polyangiaceae bacterium]
MKHPTRVRYVLPILGLLVLIAALVGVKFAQISTLIGMGKAMQKAGPPPEVVSTAVSQQKPWEAAISAVGSIAAVKGVAVSNDAPGIVSRILFESGASVRQGQVLVELDTSVERAQLASAKARMDLASVTAGRSRSLVQSDAIPRSQLDTDEAQLKTATMDLGALQAQIDRKVVRAPFSGRLGIRAVNVGQYLNAGTSVTVLEAIDSVYVDFELPQQDLADVSVGMPVRVTIEGAASAVQDGAIAAVDPEIDSTTRTIKLRATVPNKQERLRPGMFANVSVLLPKRDDRIIVPSTALVHASYGDSVFVVENKKDEAGGALKGPDGKLAKSARQQFVRVGEARGDFVAILDGVAPGQEVVSGGAFKLRNGSGIVVNNAVKATPELNPHPDNQ